MSSACMLVPPPNCPFLRVLTAALTSSSSGALLVRGARSLLTGMCSPGEALWAYRSSCFSICFSFETYHGLVAALPASRCLPLRVRQASFTSPASR